MSTLITMDTIKKLFIKINLAQTFQILSLNMHVIASDTGLHVATLILLGDLLILK